MRSKGPRDAVAVAGHELGARLGPHLKLTIGGLLLIGISIILISLIVSKTPTAAIGMRMSAGFVYFIVFGAMMVLSTLPVMIVVLIRRRKYIIGRDRLQLVVGDRVLGQLPFYNILDMRMGMVLTESTSDIDILIKDHKDRRTWWPRDSSQQSDEADICIRGGATVDATWLRMKLHDALHHYRNRNA